MDEEEARARVMERMTLKHKNNKWLKSAMRHGDMAQDGTREAINENIQLEQKLRKKMSNIHCIQ